MRYFRISMRNRFFSSKKTFAYLSVNKSNEVDNDISEEYVKYVCPYCGYNDINLFYPEKNVAVFNKDKVGDFSIGCNGYGHFAISEKFLKILLDNNIKGTANYKKYTRMETVKKEKITSISGDYYAILIDTIPLELKYINDEKIVKSERSEKRCIKCYPPFLIAPYGSEDSLYFENLREKDLDIFCTLDTHIIIVSERFVNLCKENNISNIIEKLTEVYDVNDRK